MPEAGQRAELRTVGGNSVGGRPVLSKNALPLFLGHFDEMLPAATTAVVATPVLNGRQSEAKWRHE
jgi:hypothetical protein